MNIKHSQCFRIYCARPIVIDSKMTNNQPDILVLNKTDNTIFLIEVAYPNENNLLEKHQEKQVKYADLSTKIKEMWHGNSAKVITIIVSARV